MVLGAFKKAINQIYPKRFSAKRLEQELLEREAEIGGTLFGEMPVGHVRRFVVLDEKTIVWLEQAEPNGNNVTTRYEIYTDPIVKIQDGQPTVNVGEDESVTLLRAMRWYHYLVTTQLYSATAG